MSNRLGGKQGTSYLGTNANQPPNWTFSDRNPNQYDIQNISLGDMWLNKDNETIWVLVSLAGDPDSKGSLATWSQLDSNISNDVQTLTGNDNVIVGPDVNNNINIKGDEVGITIAGNALTNTLTVSLIGSGDEAVKLIDNDSGSAQPTNGVIQLLAGTASLDCGETVAFIGSPLSGDPSTIFLNVTDANQNTLIGKNSGNSTTGIRNTALGRGCLSSLTTGSSNTSVGRDAGSSINTGNQNTIIGEEALPFLANGSDNTSIGHSAGFAYTSNESSNISIGSLTQGIIGESNTLRIGSATGIGNGELDQSFVQGIYDISPSLPNPRPVVIDSAGQLGTGTGVAFFAYANLDISNVTGDGTPYTVNYDTESYDYGNNFSTTIFTAPLDGIYLFSFGLDIAGMSVLNTSGAMFLDIDGNVFGGSLSNFGAVQVGGVLILSNTVQVKMSQGDTASVTLRVDANTQTVGLRGFLTSNSFDTYFSGVLIQ
jgi:hypothetical protein